jgi:hypothetical protein
MRLEFSSSLVLKNTGYQSRGSDVMLRCTKMVVVSHSSDQGHVMVREDMMWTPLARVPNANTCIKIRHAPNEQQLTFDPPRWLV